MSFLTYLRQSLGFIILYCTFAVFIIGILYLEQFVHQGSWRPATVAYIALLGLVGLGLYLYYDYRRRKAFLTGLRFAGEQASLDEMTVLPPAYTAEHRLFVAAWNQVISRLRTELTAESGRHRENIRLMGMWAHYMKTPLSVIDLELQRLDQLEIPLPGEVKVALQSVAEENRRLGRSLQALINMLRLEDFTADFRPEQIDLLELVRQLINDSRRLFITHHVYPRITTDGGEEPGAPDSEEPGAPAGEDPAGEEPTGDDTWCSVVSDRKWLRFILEQVLHNAVKYSSTKEEEPPGLVTFSCWRDQSGEVILTIADNGIGIEAEDLGRVFSPFYTGIHGRSYPGSTGMGLYLAQRAARQLGHRLHLESAPGRGTKVHLHFPAAPTIFSGLKVTTK